jgi:hypothetical protein
LQFSQIRLGDLISLESKLGTRRLINLAEFRKSGEDCVGFAKTSRRKLSDALSPVKAKLRQRVGDERRLDGVLG